ncbi:PTC7 [Candida pseudojiufengensis]|uniref:PTC7 n=1 Tax=Candida pseudojiufengensis TaxID=497109 RepID=UPI00222439CD|nr:PTC7 [Candida pseudojiufengensis]KAI5959389.1 PTC7 [Candida pseudojiufengensis]
MLLSFISKRSIIPTFSQSFIKNTIIHTTRSFSSTNYNSNSYTSSSSNSSGSSSSWNSNGGDKSYSTSSTNPSSSQPPASTSASLNYDSALTTFNICNIAVAYQPKNRKPSTNLFKKKNNTAALDSPTGEDNLFVTKQIKDGSIAIGVADGVGGWSEAGYDSSAISRELCSHMKYNFENSKPDSSITPKSILDESFKQILKSDKVEIGGTTACLGIITTNLKLKVANLGDSWCGLFRDYKLIKETNFQTHNFNTPYQLAKIPQHILKKAELEGRRYIIDSPNLADEYEWDLQKNDLIMFATDGVTDNVIPQDIEIFLKDELGEANKSNKLDQVANKFVKEVVKVSKDSNYPSAFAQELSRLTGQKYLGGKEDDITIVLVKVL